MIVSRAAHVHPGGWVQLANGTGKPMGIWHFTCTHTRGGFYPSQGYTGIPRYILITGIPDIHW